MSDSSNGELNYSNQNTIMAMYLIYIQGSYYFNDIWFTESYWVKTFLHHKFTMKLIYIALLKRNWKYLLFLENQWQTHCPRAKELLQELSYHWKMFSLLTSKFSCLLTDHLAFCWYFDNIPLKFRYYIINFIVKIF